MDINLNDAAQITLTSFGADLYNKWHDEIRYPSWKPANKKEGDVINTQLWELFQIFGKHIYLGMTGVPFEELNIKIKVKP